MPRFKVWQAFVLGAFVLAAAGCGSHPPLERPSYDLAKALYAVCNRQSTEGLQKFDTVLAESIAEGKVGPNEETALREIAAVAAAGDWQAAQEQARELIAGQNP
jgi:predicted small lipoprotein YifL